MTQHPAIKPTLPARTRTLILHGSEQAVSTVARLVLCSQWFQFEPLPDDDYAISVKEEYEPAIRKFLREIGFAPPDVPGRNVGRSVPGVGRVDPDPGWDDDFGGTSVNGGT